VGGDVGVARLLAYYGGLRPRGGGDFGPQQRQQRQHQHFAARAGPKPRGGAAETARAESCWS